MSKNGENITFAGGRLDRAQHLRAKAGDLAKQADACMMLLWRGKPLLEGGDTPRLCWLPANHSFVSYAAGAPVFLGLINGAPHFAQDVSSWEGPVEAADYTGFLDTSAQTHPDLPKDSHFRDLRNAITALSGDDAGDAATAKAILGWHETHRFCARCGAPSLSAEGGWQRNCPACNAAHFPRTDPVVIMLVVHGNDVLLGRSPHWPEGMYSLLAGFVEPGESLESAVRREVAEETAVICGTVRYLACQPWPFPSSLMLGCYAEATSRDITIDPNELAAAFWVSRERLVLALAGHDPKIKPARKGAIAHTLLQAWVQDSLDDLT
ncbi:MAG: NAD(+) diphosphatase [Paracoccaceae bacterium]